MIALKEEFSRIEISGAAHFRNLTLFPLLRPAAAIAEPDYLLAEDAIAQGLARVTELGSGGSVPELRFENSSDKPVLLLDGEELIGAKQNRVLNLTVLAPPKRAITIPVSCVEAGRWHMERPDFEPAQHVLYSQCRAAQAAQVTASMRATGARRSNQSAVWEDIEAKSRRMAAASPTRAMSAMFELHAGSVEEYVRAFAWQEGQCGVAFGIAGEVLGLDLFDCASTMQRFFAKLVRSYALDALDAPGGRHEPSPRASLDALLRRASEAPSFTEPAIGLGKDLRLSGQDISGAALWAAERYVHVCVFAGSNGGPEQRFTTHMSRPARRRG